MRTLGEPNWEAAQLRVSGLKPTLTVSGSEQAITSLGSGDQADLLAAMFNDDWELIGQSMTAHAELYTFRRKKDR